MKYRTPLVEIISILFIILFMYAAVSKLMDPESFEGQIGQSPLLEPFAPFVTWAIPIIEIAISLMLAISKYRLVGFVASFGLMVLFTAYIIAILNFSVHIPCACGGVLQDLGWTEHLIFNIAFVVLAVVGVFLERTKLPVHQRSL